MKKIKWGILSTAKIGLKAVIPGIQKSQYCEVLGIASRDKEKAEKVCHVLNIPKVYGSYEEILQDPDIDVIYNPLPNHLHVPYTIKAMEAGKHVLCEKPLAMNATEATKLLLMSREYPHLKVMEAFMYRFHPQWKHAKDVISRGLIGEVKVIHSIFSYFNRDAQNIRNRADYGGGGLMDIGCYCISQSRYVFENEPVRVTGSCEIDPDFKVDRITNAILDFGGRTGIITCGTQMVNTQGVQIYGTKGKIEIKRPFSISENEPGILIITTDDGESHVNAPEANNYTLQCDRLAESIIGDKPVPTPLDDAVNNMKVIDAIFKSCESGEWVEL